MTDDFTQMKLAYPDLAQFILAINSSSDQDEAFWQYSSKLEKLGNFNKLKGWLTYWWTYKPVAVMILLNRIKHLPEDELNSLRKLIETFLLEEKNEYNKIKYLLLSLLLSKDIVKVKNFTKALIYSNRIIRFDYPQKRNTFKAHYNGENTQDILREVSTIYNLEKKKANLATSLNQEITNLVSNLTKFKGYSDFLSFRKEEFNSYIIYIEKLNQNLNDQIPLNQGRITKTLNLLKQAQKIVKAHAYQDFRILRFKNYNLFNQILTNVMKITEELFNLVASTLDKVILAELITPKDYKILAYFNTIFNITIFNINVTTNLTLDAELSEKILNYQTKFNNYNFLNYSLKNYVKYKENPEVLKYSKYNDILLLNLYKTCHLKSPNSGTTWNKITYLEEQQKNLLKKGQVSFREINRILSKAFFQSYANLAIYLQTEINREKLGKDIIKALLDRSDYELILNYIYTLCILGDFPKILSSLPKLELMNKNDATYKNLIMKITNYLINTTQVANAFIFLNSIRVKRYLDYLNPNRTYLEYIKLIPESNDLLSNSLSLNIKKHLFYEGNVKTYANESDLRKAWLAFLGELPKNQGWYENVAITLIEALTSSPFEEVINDQLWSQFYQELVTNYPKIDVSNLSSYYYKAWLKLEAKIWELKTLAKQREMLENIKYLNFNQYQNNDKVVPKYFLNYNLGYEKNKAKEYLTKLINEVTNQDLENIIYFYMNTTFKYIISIDKFFNQLRNKGFKNIFAKLAKYRFYGILRKDRKGNYFFRIYSVLYNNVTFLENNRFLILGGYYVNIAGCSDVYNKLDLRNFESENQNKVINQDELVMNKLIRLLNNISNKTIKDYLQNTKYHLYFYPSESDIWNNLGQTRKKIRYFNENSDYINDFLKPKYHDQVYELLKNIIAKKQASLFNLYDFYLNSLIRYILSLDEFLSLIDLNKYPVQGGFLTKYPLLFQNIDSQNKVTNLILVNFANLYYQGSNINKLLVNGYAVMAGLITGYDALTNRFYLTDFNRSAYMPDSKTYLIFKNILLDFLDSKNPEGLKRLNDLPEIPEFNVNTAYDNYENVSYSLVLAKVLMRKIFIELVADLNQVKDFVLLLGKNNYWETSMYLTSDSDRPKEEAIKNFRNIILKQLKNISLENLLFLYQKSYLNRVINLQDLLAYYFQVNKEEDVAEDGSFDLSKYNFILPTRDSRDQVDDTQIHYIYLFNRLNKLKITNYNYEYNAKYIRVKFLKYNCLYNTFRVEKLPSEDLNYKKINLLKQIKDIKEILTTYTYLEIGTYLEKDYVKKINHLFLTEPITSNILDVLTNEESNLNELFISFAKKNIPSKPQEIVILYKLFNQTILSYVINSLTFLEAIKDCLNNNLTLSVRFKIVEKANDEYLVNFLPRHELIKATLINSSNLKLEANEKYVGVLQAYQDNKMLIKVRFAIKYGDDLDDKKI